ncbi:hypothetical protein NKH84_24955 [Mesorhizobium sp. M0902]|uniref:hypothetical protein n=1 Tax=unclassified Mesorhizobium TaxID=325217 RepID=UPI003336110B
MGRRIDGIARLDFRENAALHVRPQRMVLGNGLHKRYLERAAWMFLTRQAYAIGVEGGSWLS